jgi:hypothetical protein
LCPFISISKPSPGCILIRALRTSPKQLVFGVWINLYLGLLVLIVIATITPSVHVVVAAMQLLSRSFTNAMNSALPFSVRVIDSCDIADIAADRLMGVVYLTALAHRTILVLWYNVMSMGR